LLRKIFFLIFQLFPLEICLGKGRYYMEEKEGILSLTCEAAAGEQALARHNGDEQADGGEHGRSHQSPASAGPAGRRSPSATME
jgi:hypothetical protein